MKLIKLLFSSILAISNSQSFLNFLTFGDWGAAGIRKLTNQMEIQSAKNNISFVISTGDNFYMNGVSSINDPIWNTYFQNSFNGPYLSKTNFYCVLGNHDYGYNRAGNVISQMEYNSVDKRWNLPNYWYSKIFNSVCPTGKICDDSFTAHFVFIDTQIFQPTVGNFVYGHPERFTMLKDHMTWFENELRTSTANWLFVVGHYQMYLNQGDNKPLISLLKEKMLKYKVDAYFCGHIHNLQILKLNNENIRYYVSGAGMSARTDNPELKSSAQQLFFGYKKQGFMISKLTKTQMEVGVYFNDGTTPTPNSFIQKAYRKPSNPVTPPMKTTTPITQTTTPITQTPPTIDTFSYIECLCGPRPAKTEFITNKNMNIEFCSKYMTTKEMPYFWVSGIDCGGSVSINMDNYIKGQCNYQCPGNKTEFCGNNLKCISLYKIDGLVNRRRIR